jgi:hypothetical protein
VSNLRGNLSNLHLYREEQDRSFFEGKRAIVQEALRGQVRQFIHVPQLSEFQDQFKTIRSRYKFLVVTGASQTGKTVWASHITGKTEEVFYVNCAQCPEPDLRGLTVAHKVVLLDEASPSMILGQKLLIQGPPEWVGLGCSTTNCHAYKVFVSGIQFVVCSNKWTSEVAELKVHEDREWLEDNSIVVEIGRKPMFI